MQKRLNDKQKMLAYIMTHDQDIKMNKNITQKEIAGLFGVSQPTISQGIKEMSSRIQINQLQKQLASLKGEALDIIKKLPFNG